ncbi:MAG: hypothetical protein F4X25_09675 [Chloroflexi bacterium]|nr:hypothetical protein [Chloroflexota bacterium]
MEEFEVYYTTGEVQAGDPANAGISPGDLPRLERQVRETGVAYRVVEGLTEQEREEAYVSRAVRPSVSKRYRVRRIFGTNKYSGQYFGGAVPALVVLENGRPVDVYPHEEQDGTIVTIRDYLDRLGGGSGGADLARRMDALRARIGGVDVSVRELIEDGRRF